MQKGRIPIAGADKTDRWTGTGMLCSCVAAILSIAIGGCCSPATTVLLVRHAEKGLGADPDLTAAGHARARALVEVAANADVAAIYHTQLERTRQTAAPLAARLGVPMSEMTVLSGEVEAHAAEVAKDILTHHEGQTVVVVGHSNTVPLIIEKLGAPAPPDIPETEYDHCYLVIKRKGRVGELLHSRYGP